MLELEASKPDRDPDLAMPSCMGKCAVRIWFDEEIIGFCRRGEWGYWTQFTCTFNEVMKIRTTHEYIEGVIADSSHPHHNGFAIIALERELEENK